MAQSLLDVVLHIVFSTKDRIPWIQSDVEEELYRYISGTCRHFDCPVITINGVADHIHVLLRFGKMIPVSKLIAEMKSNSSRWIKTKGKDYCDFAWQKGYGGFSVSRPMVDSAIGYIGKQKEHHKGVGFKEEFLSMLNRAQIPYDERYLWD